LGCLAVPERGEIAGLPLAGEEFIQCRRNAGRVGPDELVGADGDGFGALGVVAEG